MYKKGAGNDKQGKDAGNRTLCPYRNFSQAIMVNLATLYNFAQLRIRQIFFAKFPLGCLVFPRRTVFFGISALFFV